MRRTNIYLTDEEHRRLVILAKEEGITMAEVVRRILDRELGLTQEVLTLREAVRLSAGAWADRTDEDIEELRALRSRDRLNR